MAPHPLGSAPGAAARAGGAGVADACWGAGAGTADALWFVLVGVCWGLTNPFIARASKAVDAAQVAPPHAGALERRVRLAWALLRRWQYVLPLAINLSGSVVFYKTLSHAGAASPRYHPLTCTSETG
jgi:hypothetical protein